jgi:hypothetical protein
MFDTLSDKLQVGSAICAAAGCSGRKIFARHTQDPVALPDTDVDSRGRQLTACGGAPSI